MGEKRLVAPDKRKLRNLRQYKDMSDEEFDEVWEKRKSRITLEKDFESRIQQTIDEFSKDYDLDDLNSNDIMTLRHLAQAINTLEDYEQLIFDLRMDEGVDIDNITLVEKLSKITSQLRMDISKLQNDLNITRKIRSTDEKQSVIGVLDDLKRKAKQFYDQKMSYIFCPRCHTLLGTIWTLYPNEKRNKVTLVCNKKLDSGEPCGYKVTIGTDELLENKGTNEPEITPESML